MKRDFIREIIEAGASQAISPAEALETADDDDPWVSMIVGLSDMIRRSLSDEEWRKFVDSLPTRDAVKDELRKWTRT